MQLFYFKDNFSRRFGDRETDIHGLIINCIHFYAFHFFQFFNQRLGKTGFGGFVTKFFYQSFGLFDFFFLIFGSLLLFFKQFGFYF